MKKVDKEKPPKVFYVLAPLFSVLLALAAVELFLAIFYPIPFFNEGGVFFKTDPFTGHLPKENSIGKFQNEIPVKINSKGLRDDEITLKKEDGVFRILVIGDSFTFGNNVQQEETYPQILEKLLNENHEKTIEVVNAGVGAWEPFQYYQYYKYYGKQFDPDLILIGFFTGNDTYNQIARVDQLGTAVMGVLVRKEAAESRYIKIKVFLYENLNIIRFFLRKRIIRGNVTRDNCEDFTSFFLNIQRARMRNHLKRSNRQYNLAKNSVYQISQLKKAADDDSVPLVVVLIPDENQINPALQKIIVKDDELKQYDFTMPQAMLTEMFHHQAIPTIDLLPWFIEDPRCLYMNDTHWTPEGQELAASVILREITPFLPRQ